MPFGGPGRKWLAFPNTILEVTSTDIKNTGVSYHTSVFLEVRMAIDNLHILRIFHLLRLLASTLSNRMEGYALQPTSCFSFSSWGSLFLMQGMDKSYRYLLSKMPCNCKCGLENFSYCNIQVFFDWNMVLSNKLRVLERIRRISLHFVSERILTVVVDVVS